MVTILPKLPDFNIYKYLVYKINYTYNKLPNLLVLKYFNIHIRNVLMSNYKILDFLNMCTLKNIAICLNIYFDNFWNN